MHSAAKLRRGLHGACAQATYGARSLTVRFIRGTPGPLELFTSPAGLMAVLYGRAGNQQGTSASKTAPGNGSPQQPGSHTAAAVGDVMAPHEDPGGSGGGGDRQGDDGIFARLRAMMRQEAVFLALVIVALSAIWELLNGQKSVVYQHVKDVFTVTLEVRSSQEEYAMIMDWMGRHPCGQRAHNLSLKPITVADERSFWNSGESNSVRSEEARAVLVPGYGSHYFTHGATRLWVSRAQDETKKQNAGSTRLDRENDILSITFLTRRRDVVESFLDDVRASWRANVQNRVRIYANEQYGDSWKLLTERTRRPLETLFLPPSILSVADEIRAFLQLQSVYASLGIPWRRGYLFEGPPGTGKTSLVTALAGEIGLPIYILSLQTRNLDDASLLSAVSCVPRRSILLIEDIENAIKTPDSGSAVSGASTTTIGGDGESGVSMSALLNALDGVASSEGRILIITSNNPDALPSKDALLRPGRVDRRVTFRHMTDTTQETMERAFLSRLRSVPGLPAKTLDALNQSWHPDQPERAVQATTSPAVVQQRLLEAIFAATQPETEERKPRRV